MLISLLRTLLVLAFVGILASALSSPGTTDRKGFLQKSATAASALIGTATSTCIGGVEPVLAAKEIYRPAPNSLNGQIHVITGASTGLGLESAKRLAAAGATVVLTTRTTAKGERAVNQVQDYLAQQKQQEKSVSISNSQLIYFLTLDLDDLSSVKSFPERYQRLLGPRPIDVLMNNAGVAAITNREVTKDGFERTFQSNHLGPYVLTALLFPNLNHKGARIINVSSIAHNFVINESGGEGLDLNNLNGELYYGGSGWPAYCNSKLENLLFSQELQRRVDKAGLEWLTVTALHPGTVGTDIWRSTYMGMNEKKKKPVFSLQAVSSSVFYTSLLTTEEGANTQVWLAAMDNNKAVIAKGQYYDENRKIPKLLKYAQDRETAQELWGISEKLSGVEFKVE
jgi:NAD(P)-dependent dehydrogenase (short-subunit alcohol dehydrogenase family)